MNAQYDYDDKTDWEPSKYRGMYKDLLYGLTEEEIGIVEEASKMVEDNPD